MEGVSLGTTNGSCLCHQWLLTTSEICPYFAESMVIALQHGAEVSPPSDYQRHRELRRQHSSRQACDMRSTVWIDSDPTLRLIVAGVDFDNGFVSLGLSSALQTFSDVSSSLNSSRYQPKPETSSKSEVKYSTK